ncbi:MAG: hypothetical protein CVU09_16075 [Bacteroidetes bacterium HGW-Bacteroidetes-4]|nr:MAG: hypothetical protein CVU09_16075 [Bacteroidetes bacterium HGW-Bacteroidetes-4]
MKKVAFFILAVAAVATLTSCGGTKDLAKGRQEITIPCADKGRSDAEFFRASNVGKSSDMAMSREKALTLTKARLASLIGSKIKSVTERYANEMDAGGASEFSQTFENMTRDVVNQQLADVTIICEKTFEAEGGGYETFMALEVSKDVIYNGIDKGISRDKKLEVMYDREKFREKFDEEMKNLDAEY